MYKLRPHHLLCLHFFRGSGYSLQFVEHMARMVEAMIENPLVELVAGADQVCVACPHRVGVSGCESQDKVMAYDRRVLEKCQLSIGTQLHWQDFLQRITDKILAPGYLTQVCCGCQWIEICKGLQMDNLVAKK